MFAWWHWFTSESFDITPAARTCVYVNAHKINSSEFRRWVHSRLQVPSDPAHSGSIPEKDKNQVRRRRKISCVWHPRRGMRLAPSSLPSPSRSGEGMSSRSVQRESIGVRNRNLFSVQPLYFSLSPCFYFTAVCLFMFPYLFVCQPICLSTYVHI